MFGIFKKKTYQIDFTETNKVRFITLLTEIYEILRDSAYSAQANWIKQILVTVQNEDAENFKKKVLSNDLLGGSGSVVDVWIEQGEKMNRLDDLMNDFLSLTIKSGLNHRAVKSRIIKK
jgi:translation initiation factor 1 (eIF-1/SUI1)